MDYSKLAEVLRDMATNKSTSPLAWVLVGAASFAMSCWGIAQILGALP